MPLICYSHPVRMILGGPTLLLSLPKTGETRTLAEEPDFRQVKGDIGGVCCGEECGLWSHVDWAEGAGAILASFLRSSVLEFPHLEMGAIRFAFCRPSWTAPWFKISAPCCRFRGIWCPFAEPLSKQFSQSESPLLRAL